MGQRGLEGSVEFYLACILLTVKVSLVRHIPMSCLWRLIMSASLSNNPHHSSLFHILSEHAARVPKQVAIAAPGRSSMTYRNLIQRLSRMQEALHGLGIGCNDRVALAIPPGPELAVALLGVASTATCVPMHP